MSAINRLANSSLKTKLIELIRLKGPITVADYMKIVLTNPESGFYTNKDVFGVKGHFTTNPEISQMFGEVLGVWILQEWRRFGCPSPLRLVELGPGRGTLMLDLMRTMKNFNESPQVQMIEISPKLQEIQSQTLQQVSVGSKIEWFTSVDATEKKPDGFTAYIAHEFLDALPIHKFVREPETKRWRELMIDYDQKQELRFCIARQPSLSTRLLVPEDFDGEHLEVCPEAAIHLEKISKRLNASGSGCSIVCDYGFENEISRVKENSDQIDSLRPIRYDRDTFRAFKNHESWPPLRDPGDADLTADVDFSFLKKQLKDKAIVFGSVNQGSFLIKCGMQVRLEKLLEKASDDERKDLVSGFNLMTNEMGQRYRFLSMFPKGCEHLFEGDPPAGFS